MSIGENVNLVKVVLKKSVGIIKTYPKVLVPLGVVACLQSVLLFLLFLAPQNPFSIVLAPPIRAFWGEVYLHYPANFLLLPRIFNYGNIAISLLIGSLMTAMMVAMVYQANRNIVPGKRSNFRKAIKRYITLVALWVVIFTIISILFKGPKVFILKYYFHNTGFFTRLNVVKMFFAGSILMSILVEMFVAYAVPAVIIENKTMLQAIKRSFCLAWRFFMPTFILVGLPVFIIFFISILKWQIPTLIETIFPEITLYILGFSIICSLVISWVVTASVTTLFFMNNEIEESNNKQ